MCQFVYYAHSHAQYYVILYFSLEIFPILENILGKQIGPIFCCICCNVLFLVPARGEPPPTDGRMDGQTQRANRSEITGEEEEGAVSVTLK